jgi:hypothetical protein
MISLKKKGKSQKTKWKSRSGNPTAVRCGCIWFGQLNSYVESKFIIEFLSSHGTPV